MNPMLLRLKNAQNSSNLLSQWENGFIESLHAQFNKHGKLSPRQIEIFERIENEKLSSKAQDTRQQWIDNYNGEKRETARICAEYYAKTGYFTNVAFAILENVDHIPSEKEWRKMCENKYAKKVLINHALVSF